MPSPKKKKKSIARRSSPGSKETEKNKEKKISKLTEILRTDGLL